MSNEDKQILIAIQLELIKAAKIQDQFKRDMDRIFATINELIKK